MTFGTPLGRNTTVNITVGGKDFYLWPGYSGEDYPPTFGSGAGYSRDSGAPCYQINPSATASISFNPVGSIGPDPAKTTLVVQFEARLQPTASYSSYDPPSVGLGYGGRTVGVRSSGAQGYQVLLGSNAYYAAASNTQPSNGYKYLSLGWHIFTLRYRADGTATPILCDALPLWITGDNYGNNYYRATLTGFTPGSLTTQALTTYLASAGSGSYGSMFRNVYATWETP